MKRVLVAPLDWGLGHATRCIPVIRELLARNCEVVIAGSGASLALLKKEFPSLKCLPLPGYDPVYPTRGSMVWKMAGQLFKFIRVIQEEHVVIEKIIKQHKIDIVISDNRYGCWSSSIPSVFITHQSNILMPMRFGWLQGIVRRANEKQMLKFSIRWIPDNPDLQLAGQLTPFTNPHGKNQFEYIGLLSRFQPSESVALRYDIVAIFSGPEPQRTILEEIVLLQLKNSSLNYFVVRGLPLLEEDSGNERVRNFMTASELQILVQSAKVIIARSGYSTVMDMAALGKKVIFIPTPGQTEQEYLAKTLLEKGIAYCVSQNLFDLRTALDESEKSAGFPLLENDQALLKNAIDKLLL